MTEKTAILVGASSMLSKEIAKQLSTAGMKLVLLAQAPQSLDDLLPSLLENTLVVPFDITDDTQIQQQLAQVWQQVGGADLVLVNTGLNSYSPDLPWQLEEEIIEVNVTGFAAVCNACFRLFREQGYGQLAAINSIAGLRGGPSVAFHASKAFAINYLEGLSMHAQRLKLPIDITDIQLGLLDKAAMQQSRIWLSPVDEVAKQVVSALLRRKRRVVVTKRWRTVAWLTKLLPEYIYNTRHWKQKKR